MPDSIACGVLQRILNQARKNYYECTPDRFESFLQSALGCALRSLYKQLGPEVREASLLVPLPVQCDFFGREARSYKAQIAHQMFPKLRQFVQGSYIAALGRPRVILVLSATPSCNRLPCAYVVGLRSRRFPHVCSLDLRPSSGCMLRNLYRKKCFPRLHHAVYKEYGAA